MFRSSSAAERAEAEGRVDDAARLYVASGDRPEAVQVLLRAGETARTLDERRAFLTRAHGLARTPELRDIARRALAMVALAEAEASAPRTDEARRRLTEGAADLEALGAFTEAGRAWALLEDREAVVRVLTLAGDVDSLERETSSVEFEERLGLRRRAALEEFDALWRSGDRARALKGLRQWVDGHPDDHEARQHLDTRAALVVRTGALSVDLDGVSHAVAWRFPLVLGREGDVALRGGSVSRRHCRIDRTDTGVFTVEDCASRAGTSLDGLPVAGVIPLVADHALHLGTDLTLRVGRTDADGTWTLEVEKGMDRGRRVVLVPAQWSTPCGPVCLGEAGPELTPVSPVLLNGVKVAVAFTLCRGDSVEGSGHALTVVR